MLRQEINSLKRGPGSDSGRVNSWSRVRASPSLSASSRRCWAKVEPRIPGRGVRSHRVQALAVLGNEAATPEQGQIVQRLVQRVDYDGRQGKLAIVLRQHDAETPSELSA
jgi:hypothetical protein